MEDNTDLVERAKEVLNKNKQGDYTIPAEGLYPHQWLWDSCFIAIGLRHYDIDRAQMEIKSLMRGQWANGMIPHMVFADGREHRRDADIWRSWMNPYAPDKYPTSGITQPPVLAEAIVKIGEKLELPERRSWYQTMYPGLLAHHEWLYKDRDPHDEGLTLQVHPWETGLDNTPPWMSELRSHDMPMWVRLADKKPFQFMVNLFRRDTQFVAPGQRLSAFEATALYSVQNRLKRKAYQIDKILSHSLFAIEDLTFNSVFVRANQHLKHIAKTIDKELPEDLKEKMKKTENALDTLWDAYSGQYYSRSFVTHKLIKVPSIAALMPLYSGSISKERAEQLVQTLRDKKLFWTKYPVPSVPINSEWFKPHGYWQGPVWINANWLIIEGLNQYGYHEEAELIAKSCIELVEGQGFYEYFSPIDGTKAGANNFSWTSALAIDIISAYPGLSSPSQ